MVEVYNLKMRNENISMANLSHLPPRITTVEKSDKEEAIATMKSRFK